MAGTAAASLSIDATDRPIRDINREIRAAIGEGASVTVEASGRSPQPGRGPADPG